MRKEEKQKPSPKKRSRKEIPKKKKSKKIKWLSEENLQLRKEEKQKAGEKGKETQLNAEFWRTARRDKKGFLSEQCKEIEEINRKGKIRDGSRKLEISRENFMQDGHDKGQKWQRHNRRRREDRKSVV